MSNSLGVYSYILWGNQYDMPYREMMLSVEPIADTIVMITDERFNDGTIETIQEMIKDHPKIKLHLVHLDLDDPGVDGKTKALGRTMSECDVLMQMDADEVLHEQFYDRVMTHVQGFQLGQPITGTGVLNYFNGEHFKYSAAGWVKERFSWNSENITHGIPYNHRIRRGKYFYAHEGTTDGAGYIDTTGRGMVADYMLCQRKGFPRDFCDNESIWIHHYSWYDVPRKWNMQTTWDHFWGQLYGKHEGLAEYKMDRDGNPVSFWKPQWRSGREPYEEAVLREMTEGSIKPVPSYITHPKVMSAWVNRAMIYDPGNLWRWKRKLRRGRIR